MNILIIGKPYENLISEIKTSKLLNKLYTAQNERYGDLPNIVYDSMEELISKAKALEIDIAVNLEKKLINDDFIRYFKEHKINLITVNEKWLNLEESDFAVKELLNHYSINTPKLIKAPLKFPVVVRTQDAYKIVKSITELTEFLEDCYDKPIIEEYLDGNSCELLNLWDGKSLFCFNFPFELTEVQKDRFDLLKTKLSFMLSDEKADFTGFFTIKLTWARNDWYVNGFEMNLKEKSCFNGTKHDFLYILNSAIYQKLNEL